MSSEKPHLQQAQELIDSLQLEHPSLSTDKSEAELRALHASLQEVVDETTMTSADLQSKLMAWYELNEIQRELEYLLKQERREFACFELARVLAQSKEEISCSLHDLEVR